MKQGFVVSFKGANSFLTDFPQLCFGQYINSFLNIGRELQGYVPGQVTFLFGEETNFVIEMAYNNRIFARVYLSNNANDNGVQLFAKNPDGWLLIWSSQLDRLHFVEDEFKKHLKELLCYPLRAIRKEMTSSVEEIDASILAVQEGIYSIDSQQTNFISNTGRGYRK